MTLTTATCKRCNQTWTIRKENPKQCPKCKTPYWNKPLTPKGIKANQTKRKHK